MAGRLWQIFFSKFFWFDHLMKLECDITHSVMQGRLALDNCYAFAEAN